MGMSKGKALLLLNRQIGAIDEVMGQKSSSPQFNAWFRATDAALSHIFGDESEQRCCFQNIQFGLYGCTTSTPDSAWDEAQDSGLAQARALLEGFQGELHDYWDDAQPEFADASCTAEERVVQLCSRFHRVALQLAKRREARATLAIGDEYDVQDLLRALLQIDFQDVRPEEWTPSYAGKSSRMDFLLKPERLVLEVKKTRDKLEGKEVADQLIIDIERYRSHQDCECLVCFVYDPELRIANPVGLAGDLGGSREGLKVRVIIAPEA